MQLSCLPPYTVSTYRHCISGGLLSSQLCKHHPYKSSQPTYPPLTQHSHNEKNELNEASFSNRCTYPDPWNEPSQLFLLSSPTWSPPQCSGLPASTFYRVWRGKRAEHHLGKDLAESHGNLVSFSSQTEACKMQSCDVWHLHRACKKQCDLTCCSSCLFSLQFPFFGSSCTMSVPQLSWAVRPNAFPLHGVQFCLGQCLSGRLLAVLNPHYSCSREEKHLKA